MVGSRTFHHETPALQKMVGLYLESLGSVSILLSVRKMKGEQGEQSFDAASGLRSCQLSHRSTVGLG